ncbi:MAG: hypothetical protein IJ896_15165 [Fibrobacter sp.]|nr:hypothetical protein [Fibrobacter sp.]
MESITFCHPGGSATTDRVHALQDFTGSFTADLDDSFGMVSIGTSCLQNDSFEDNWTG